VHASPEATTAGVPLRRRRLSGDEAAVDMIQLVDLFLTLAAFTGADQRRTLCRRAISGKLRQSAPEPVACFQTTDGVSALADDRYGSEADVQP